MNALCFSGETKYLHLLQQVATDRWMRLLVPFLGLSCAKFRVNRVKVPVAGVEDIRYRQERVRTVVYVKSCGLIFTM